MAGVLAIDYGERKTGFATTDALRLAFQPLAVIRTEGTGPGLLEHIEQLLSERDVSTLLVGMPLHMDGEAGERAEAVQAFIRRLRERFPKLEVRWYDERLTTKEAESRLREQGVGRRKVAAQKDSWSALVLLEDWVLSGEPRC